MGSVKDLEVLRKPTKDSMGIARFHFSDRYSVFDWGEMPDQLKNKGSALCVMGAYCFEKLEELGVKTHYRGVVTLEGKLTSVFELEKPVNVMEISLVRVFKPKFKGKTYDYSIYAELAKRGEGNFLLPLEVVYRNGLPEGSSVFRRLEKGEVTLDALGLNHYP
ncbi:MAG: phosphoribosylaminoimidazolesuccinocarboxamide synthase, partial [Candidatus Bathyarchaeota archaeon]|nr:phosphoribosylaminoimidazolesuccinocarboxamide synthase [Candidatus Bathyarchaeota archaeon]